MSQQQASLWRRVAIAGLLASLTIVGSAWDGVEAGAPRRDPQSVRQTADKHVTKKARALGMTNTTYINASGLPADEQITTARDQALTKKRVFDAMDSGLAVFLAGAQHRTVGASALALLPHEA